jgi:hypothetical protein
MYRIAHISQAMEEVLVQFFADDVGFAKRVAGTFQASIDQALWMVPARRKGLKSWQMLAA